MSRSKKSLVDVELRTGQPVAGMGAGSGTLLACLKGKFAGGRLEVVASGCIGHAVLTFSDGSSVICPCGGPRTEPATNMLIFDTLLVQPGQEIVITPIFHGKVSRND